MSTILEIKNSKGSTKKYSIKTKRNLYTYSMQYILRDNYSMDSNDRTIRCCCKEDNSKLYLANKKIMTKKGSKNILAIYPKSDEHDPRCPFYSYNSKMITEEEGEVIYKTYIFDDSLNRADKDKDIKTRNKIRNAKNNTYNSFCEDVIVKTNIDIFKRLIDRKFKKTSFTEFCSTYFNALSKIKISKDGNIKDHFKKIKGRYFEFGLIDHSVKLDNYSHLQEADIIDLSLKPIRKHKNSFKLGEKVAKITKNRLVLSMNNVKILKGYATPPYFYGAVYDFNKIKKMHIYPVFYDDVINAISFVESGYERLYAKNLICKNKPFLKPISGYELEEATDRFNHIRYRPDFIEFSDSNKKIKLVEVSGFDIESYKRQMKDKLDYYKSLSKRDTSISYELVVGSGINDLLYLWDGSEKIMFGSKYNNQSWADIDHNTLSWYIENLTDENCKELASMEFYRRKINKVCTNDN